jgi:hypothetical protein
LVNKDQGRTVEKWAFLACQVYLLALGVWFVAYQLADRIGYLGLVNVLAVHLFWPLPLALLRCAAGALWLAAAGPVCLARGRQFAPALARQNMPRLVPSRSPGLRVMTYNVMAMHTLICAGVDNIQPRPRWSFPAEVNTNLACPAKRIGRTVSLGILRQPTIILAWGNQQIPWRRLPSSPQALLGRPAANTGDGLNDSR